ncbi:beta-lactamase-like [Lachnospiraceae bacterium KM106-2]|nr:beta-lactamase-like [Lachnospiraceae bacterium KM106-2]
MPEIIVLPLVFQLGKINLTINPVVLRYEDELILIDAAYPGFLPDIENAFQEKGLDINTLTQVVITHHDHDHMGAVAALSRKYSKVRVRCSKEQMPYIIGRKKSLRLEQAEKTGAEPGFINMIKSVECLSKVETVEDQESIAPGVKVIETPGHMPGHISIYIEPQKTLISGDMLVLDNDKLTIADAFFALDHAAEIESVRKVSELELHKIICYHGGEYSSDHLCEELKRIASKGYGD